MSIKFQRGPSDSFHSELVRNVNRYFKAKKISRYANGHMVTKSIVLISGYFIPYLLMLTLSLPGWAMTSLCIVMGVALAGIGMSVMHDANHGAYSADQKVNVLLGYTANLIGGNRFNWRVQHNIKHHTYTNIYGADEDLHNGNLMRFSPHSEWHWYHRFQHVYSWFLYFLGTFGWVTVKDFRQIRAMHEESRAQTSFSRELTILILSKVFYFGYMIVLPVLLIDLPSGFILLGFLIVHLVAGFILTVTFQLAHVVESTAHLAVEERKSVVDSWAVHQVRTTANFSRKNKVLNWYLGGLNFQIEHHLFPHICHVHYSKIAEIVKETAERHGLVYNEYSSIFKAIGSHFRMLKLLSTEPVRNG